LKNWSFFYGFQCCYPNFLKISKLKVVYLVSTCFDFQFYLCFCAFFAIFMCRQDVCAHGRGLSHHLEVNRDPRENIRDTTFAATSCSQVRQRLALYKVRYHRQKPSCMGIHAPVSFFVQFCGFSDF